MKQRKQSKVIAILALCISVLGLTLGFAAFSNTLTISSSATVSPDASDFKLVVYGLPNEYSGVNSQYDIDSEVFSNVNSYTSTTMAGPLLHSNLDDFEFAVIDNNNFAIKNIKATFKKPGDGLQYIMVIKNAGKYDAYIDVSSFVMPDHTCEAMTGTTPELVEGACESMMMAVTIGFYDSATGKIDWDVPKYFDENGNIPVPINSYIFLSVSIGYNDASNVVRADGDFTVEWEDLELNFSTVSQ